MRYLLLAGPLLLLAACGQSNNPAPEPSEGVALRQSLNEQTADYANCVIDAGEHLVDSVDKLPGQMADEAFAACAPRREQLLSDVLKFRRLGYPPEDEARSQAIAEQSVTTLENELRDRVLIITTKRRLAEETKTNVAH